MKILLDENLLTKDKFVVNERYEVKTVRDMD